MCFTFKVKADDLKTKKLEFFHEETAQGTADRINAEIRKQIEPIILHSRAVDEYNKNLLEKNKNLENKNTLLSKENEELKGFKAVALKLLQEIGFFSNHQLSTRL